MGCKSVKPRHVQKLTPKMMKKRLEFAKQHSNWTIDDWRRVAFSDESTFECQMANSRCVWQLPGSPPPVHQKVKHPTKVMVWGIISYKGPGRLHVVEGMMDKNQYLRVIQTRVIPQLRQWFTSLDDCIFMQDSAPCHTAKIIKEYLQTSNVNVLPWPGNSPDLNPIENIWGLMKAKLNKISITTKNQIIGEVLKAWFRDEEFTEKLRNVIDSMPQRIQAVISAKCAHTKY